MLPTTDSLWDVATTDVIFLGAGFSRCASGGESPLMHDFFARLDDRKYWSLAKFLSETFNDPRKANVEEALLKLDQLCAAPLCRKDSFIEQCRRRQVDLRGELDAYIIERLGRLPIEVPSWALSLLTNVSDTTTVITTNYDNLAETALSHRRGLRHRTAETNCHHCRMCRILHNECASGGNIDGASDFWRGALLKLHGSIAWKMCGNPTCSSNLCLLPQVNCRPLDGTSCEGCGQACSPVLVHPSMIKLFERFRGLTLMWEGAYEALKSCRRAVFFGFSFPPSDAAITQMIRCTLGRSNGDLQIAVIDVEPAGRKYYQLNFIDEYSRYIVHHGLLTNMEGGTVSLEAQRAIERFLRERGGEIPAEGMPEIRSDNGSCYISRDFRTVLDEHGLGHNPIKPHCPEENGIMERANRTFREALDGEELTDLYQARDVMKRIIHWYNSERLHSALGYLRPIDYYRGDPEQLKETRRRKMAEARHQRREKNLEVWQRTLLLEPQEGIANRDREKSHCR